MYVLVQTPKSYIFGFKLFICKRPLIRNLLLDGNSQTFEVKDGRCFELIVRAIFPVSILRKSISGRHRPVRVADGPMTARCRFM